MEFSYDFAVIGGDLRQYYLARQLVLARCSIITYGIPTPKQLETLPSAVNLEHALKDSQCILAPIPLTKNQIDLQADVAMEDFSLDNLLNHFQDGQKFYAGCIPDFFISKCIEKHVFCKDFMKNEEVARFNSIATAEGTIAEIVQKYPDNLQGSKALITGFGRCARTLARKLKALDCQVTICARKAVDRFEARTEGFSSLSFGDLPQAIHSFELIVNTVPAPVFTEEILRFCTAGTQIIDIASLPGGVPETLASRYPIYLHHALSLPGKYAPKASGEKLAEIVLRERKEPLCL